MSISYNMEEKGGNVLELNWDVYDEQVFVISNYTWKITDAVSKRERKKELM